MHKHDAYNDEPVWYCAHCLSLKIRKNVGTTPDYCDSCTSTDVSVTDIFTWENKYKAMYGKKFLNDKSPTFWEVMG